MDVFPAVVMLVPDGYRCSVLHRGKRVMSKMGLSELYQELLSGSYDCTWTASF